MSKMAWFFEKYQTIELSTVIKLLLFFAIIFWSCSKNKTLGYDYFDDGSVKTSYETIDDSILLVKRFYKSGAINGVNTFVNSELKGIFQIFSETGILLEQTRWSHDKKNGVSYFYYPSGNLHRKINFENDNIVGENYEYFDNKSEKLQFRRHHILVKGNSYPNEIYKYDLEGKLISVSPLVRIKYKTDRNNCLSNMTIKLDSATFPRIAVDMGNFDNEYNLKDSVNFKSYDSKKLIINFSFHLNSEKDTTVRGIVRNYKVIETDGNGVEKVMSKYIYWSTTVKSCAKQVLATRN